jgi:hypothetical protein
MTPKEKAKELVNDYYVLFSMLLENTISEYEAAKCALLNVKNTIEALKFHTWQNRNEIEYYEEVRQELKKYE